MSSSRAGDTLSKRLSTLHAYYDGEDHVWDIGCDHGLLGLSFKGIDTVKSIHLVDPSKPVIDVLNKKLLDSYITKAKVYHSEGQALSIDSLSNCIFIAGMGGKEIGEIISHLLKSLDASSKLVISPHRKIIELRSLLHSLPLTLLKEEVLEEDGQFYQIMSLRPGDQGRAVPLYGDELWDSETGKKYLEHQLLYFSEHRDEASIGYVTFLKGRKLLKSSGSG